MYRMGRMIVCGGLLLFGLLGHPAIWFAQEASEISGAQAVRFEQSPGFFHYAALCRTAKEFMAQMPALRLPADMTESAVCWYVKGSRATRQSSGGVVGSASPEVDGKLVISAHHVRFMPRNPQFAALYADLHPQQVELKHDPGQNNATLQTSELLFSFRFSKLCPACAPGTPIAPGFVPALLDQEFSLLDDGIRRFDTGWKQIYRLSAGAPVNASLRIESATAAGPAEVHLPGARTTPVPKPSVATSSTAIPNPPMPEASSPAHPRSSAAPTATAAAMGSQHLKPLRIASAAADGMLLKKVPPAYPLEAKLVRLEGTVVLRAIIDKRGEVSEVNAVSGPPLLESAAVDAVLQWQYRPYSLKGQPIDVETTIEVVFALDGSHPAARTQRLLR